MININLIPVELRPVKKKTKAAKKTNADLTKSFKNYIILGISAFLILFAITVANYIDYLKFSSKQAKVVKAFDEIQPHVQEVREIQQKVTTVLKPEMEFLRTNVLSKAPITSILQILSEALPRGVWLTSIAISNSGKDRSFQIKGVALNSPEQTNIEKIEEYLQIIKQIIPNSRFVYSTGKQLNDSVTSTKFNATFQWEAD